MADIAGIVIASVQISAKVACLGYEYIAGWKEAPSEIRRLIDEVRSLHNTLIALQDCVSKNPQSPLLQQFNQGDGPLLRCNVVLSEFRLRLEKMRDSKGRRLKWLLSKKDTLETISRIEGYKGLFALALAVDERLKSIREVINTAKKEIEKKEDIIIQNQKTDSDTQRVWRREFDNSSIAREKILREIQEDSQRKDDARKRKEILSWLFSEVFDKKHLEIRRRRQGKTGGWLLKSLEFGRWFSSPDIPLLWGYGIPGSGKTFLASAVIDFLKDQPSTSNGRPGVAYIYFDYKESDKQVPTYVLTSLIRQLADRLPEVPKEIKDLYLFSLKQQWGEKPTLEALHTSLVAVSNSFTKVFIVCDALDECNPDNRKELLPIFHQIGNSGIKIFLTSRQHPEDIQVSLQNSARVKLSAKDEDIESYIRQKIDGNIRIKHLIGKARCEDRIISDLTKCANGMFLLVHFHIKYLCQQTTPNQILTSLDKIQSQMSVTREGLLDPVYDRVIEDIKGQQRSSLDLALAVLSWVTKARRTLLVDELQVGLAIEKGQYHLDELDLADRRVLLEVCAGLVVIDENKSGDTIQLAHYTVQEYLLRNSIIFENTEFKISTACLTYLSFTTVAEKTYVEYPKFLFYAANYLLAHLNACDEGLLVDEILAFLARERNIYLYLKFKQNSRVFNWRQRKTIVNIVKSTAVPFLPFFAAIILGNCRVLRLLLESADCLVLGSDISTIISIAKSEGNDRVVKLLQTGFDLSVVDMQMDQGLCLAASLGYKGVVQLLLEKGADMTRINRSGQTVLDVAVYGGYTELVEFLLEKGANFSTGGGFQALTVAVSDGNVEIVRVVLERRVDLLAASDSEILFLALDHGNFEIVKLLLEKGANASVVNPEGRTALQHAVLLQRVDLVRLLLEKGTDISAVDSGGRTALRQAVFKGHADTARLLIENGADISAVDLHGHTALHEAIITYRGCIDLVELLLQKGADTSAVDPRGQTALHQAAFRGHVDLVQLLLKNGADTSAVDLTGRTVLHQAVLRGHVHTVQLLLEKGADTSAADSKGRTALHEAMSIYRGCMDPVQLLDLVQLLLKNGADTSAVDQDGQTALHQAIFRGRVDIVQLLVKNGADISVVDSRGWTALQQAVWRGHEGLVELLLKNGADISSVDSKDRTAPHGAVATYRETVDRVLLLLGNSADTSAVDSRCQTALHLAVYKGRMDLVQLLLENGAEISAVDPQGQTALHEAVSTYRVSIDLVLLLLENGADTSAIDPRGQTALHQAVFRGRVDIVQLLLKRDADISAVDSEGCTALHWAVFKGYVELVQLLLEKGADISAVDLKSQTALHQAALKGHANLAQLLLENGAEISAVDSKRQTALHHAVLWERVTLAELLLERGADTSKVDSKGCTALHWAVFRGHLGLVQILLEKGADTSATDLAGQTALHQAAFKGRIDLVQLLLENGADVSVLDLRGRTTLHIAVSGYKIRAIPPLENGPGPSVGDRYRKNLLFKELRKGYTRVVKVLLDRGVDISVADVDGITPLKIAVNCRDTEMAQLLIGKSTGDS